MFRTLRPYDGDEAESIYEMVGGWGVVMHQNVLVVAEHSRAQTVKKQKQFVEAQANADALRGQYTQGEEYLANLLGAAKYVAPEPRVDYSGNVPEKPLIPAQLKAKIQKRVKRKAWWKMKA